MWFTILSALVLMVSAMQTADAQDIDWRTIRTEHFIIYHAPGMELVAERSVDLAEEWHSILSEKLGFEPKAITPIYLYPDRPSFAESTGVGRADRVVGTAHALTLRIKVDASGAFGDIRKVIPHELVHVFVFRQLRGKAMELPLYMHEGLAKYLADDWSAADAELLADAASGGGIMRFDEIAEVFPRDERKRSIAYVQSYSIVEYMADTYSPESIPDLLAEIEAGHQFDTALRYSIGRHPHEFEQEWRDFIWEEYQLNRWVKLVSGIASGIMGFLAILAFRARLTQKRRRALELEKEEEQTPSSPIDTLG